MDKSTVIIFIIAAAALIAAAAGIIIFSKKAKSKASEVKPEAPEEKPLNAEEKPLDAEEKPFEAEELPDEASDRLVAAETEETAEEIDPEEICPICGIRRKALGKEYCSACEKQLLKTKVPVLGWLAGIVVILAAVFAVAQSSLASAPAIQSFRGDVYADKKCWYSAYTSYSDVDSVISEIYQIIGQETDLLKSGCGLKAKLVNAIYNGYTPLDAANSISTFFSAETDGYVQHSKFLSGCNKLFEDYNKTFDIISKNAGDELSAEAPDVNKIIEKFNESRNEEGVNPVFVDSFICTVAEYFAPDDIQLQLDSYEKLDKTAKAQDEDYSWCYYAGYAAALLKAGEYDKAIALMDEKIANDKGNYNSYLTKLRCCIAAGKKDDADALIEEFVKYNETEDAEFVLRAINYRCAGEYDKVKTLCEEAFESYDYVPELHRQLALAYLLEKDYDNAFEQAYAAEQMAYNLYSMGDSSGYTTELLNTAYVCYSLCKQFGKCDSENSGALDEMLKSYEGEQISAEAQDIVAGKITVEKALTEGDYDLL